MLAETPQYEYRDAAPGWATRYLLPVVECEAQRVLATLEAGQPRPRAFDLGCGSGAAADRIHGLGFDVTGVDLSESGIRLAREAYPGCRFELASVYDDLAGRFGRFPLVVSLEVVEHLYDPRRFARNLSALLEPGGTAIVSTPYHGYLKNVALAVAGQLDAHFTALWDGGHIKFFSIRTLTTLLTEAGLNVVKFHRVGRTPLLAKSMVAVARKCS